MGGSLVRVMVCRRLPTPHRQTRPAPRPPRIAACKILSSWYERLMRFTFLPFTFRYGIPPSSGGFLCELRGRARRAARTASSPGEKGVGGGSIFHRPRLSAAVGESDVRLPGREGGWLAWTRASGVAWMIKSLLAAYSPGRGVLASGACLRLGMLGGSVWGDPSAWAPANNEEVWVCLTIGR